MDNKPQKKATFQWIPALIYFLTGAVIGILMMTHLDHVYTEGGSKGRIFLSLIPTLFFFLLSMLLQIIIHEAGHLFFGLLSGYRFVSFRVFSFMWIREKDGGIRFRRMSLAGTGGQCLMAPPELKDGKMPVMLYNFGGALMNIIASLVFAAAAFLCPAGSYARTVLLFPVVVGIATALTNGLPLRLSAVNNDGRNALDLSRDPRAVRAFWTQMKISEMTAEGVRLKEMPEELFTLPADEDLNNPLISSLSAFACSRLMDEHRFEEADALMAGLLSKETGIPGLYQALMKYDRLYIELITQNRPETLAALLTSEEQKILKAMKTFPSVLRTDYATALLQEKDAAKAAGIRQQFDKTAGRYPYPSEIATERELMDIAAQRAADAQING